MLFMAQCISKQQEIKSSFALILLVCYLAIASPASYAQTTLDNVTHKDVVYASAGDLDLTLDLYLPQAAENPPLLIFVHGGQWRRFDKTRNVPLMFVDQGYALASVDFRQSTVARFPAQIHDIKAAVRFLRANACEYGYEAENIAIAGNSSGGHLASLVGVSNGHAGLEGNLGDYPDISSDVQAVLSYFGAHDLTSILGQSTEFGLSVRIPALELLLGSQPEENPGLAELASPVSHVDANDPPMLLLHGDEDIQMPIAQSYQMQAVYQALGLDVYLDVVQGAGHGGNGFYTPEHLQYAIDFLERTIAN